MKSNLVVFALFASTLVFSGEADVVDFSYQCEKSCIFSLTIQHTDAGWKHYADRWEILSIDRKILATRVLAHPHGTELFTRSLANIQLPDNTKEVIIRAHDSVHSYDGKEVILKIK